MKKIGVVGAGIMGSGIAQVLTLKGYKVIMTDISEEALDKGSQHLIKNIDRSISKGRLTEEDKEKALALLEKTTDMKALREADLVIEAASEKLALKRQLFEQLDEICPSEVILATNTSSLSIDELAAGTKRPDKVIGMHFFNPVPIMKLVEVVKGEKTSSATVQVVKELAEDLDKRPVEVLDSPGFIVNRLLIPMINEAAILYGEKKAGAEAIDRAMELGANHPLGPLALADLVGLDVCLAIMETLYEAFGQEKYKPAEILQEKVAKGHLGRKTKQGFYDYS